MNELIEKLIAPLSASDIEVRVGTTSQKGFSLLIYKTARTDVKRLNDVFGLNWKNRYFADEKGLLCCGISAKVDGEWVERIDVGTESYTEKEKGSYSDAFKRAGFKWGIGAELYNSPFIWVNWDMKQNNSGKGYAPVGFYSSSVEIVDYEAVDGHVTSIVILHNGKQIYKYGEKRNGWPVYNEATPKIQKQALSEFKNICGTLEVDPVEFLLSTGVQLENEADKYKAVRHWLNGNVDMLHDQLLVYRQK